MNKMKGDHQKQLLEPFPSRPTSVLKMSENFFSNSLRSLKTSLQAEDSTYLTASTTTGEASLSSTSEASMYQNFSSSSSLDTVTGEKLKAHEMYPLHVASVINDDTAFRQLQSDLRNSHMVTSYGARYIMKPMVEKRAEEAIERQRNEERRMYKERQEQEKQQRLKNDIEIQQMQEEQRRRDILLAKAKSSNALMSKEQREKFLAKAKSITSLAFLQQKSEDNEEIIMPKLPPVRRRESMGRAA
mmetsp:Transcript_26996/g.38024  ORF Transcript_26996/g.38024 Transcript_26996/m.38024 type:complete len:244 (-) Transcript_26996:156-887(-)